MIEKSSRIPTAFMTAEAQLTIVPILCKAIGQMNVIFAHLDCQACVFLDGYGSHANVTKALEISSEHHILILKEEGETSYVNHEHDQFVSKEDKIFMYAQLSKVRLSLGHGMDQQILIAIDIDTQNLVEKESQISSLKRVSACHKCRTPFDECIKNLDALVRIEEIKQLTDKI